MAPRTIRLLASLALIIAGGFLIWQLQRMGLLSPRHIQMVAAELGPWGPVTFIALYIVATVALLPGTPFTIAAGAVFGSLFGTVYVVIGATIGAIAAFVVARLLGRSVVARFLESRFTRLAGYNDQLTTNGLGVTLFLRLVPIFPFAGLNYALGVTKVRTVDYVVGTAVGIIPGTFAYVYFGSSLLSPEPQNIVFAVLLLVLLTISFPLYRQLRGPQEENRFDLIVIGAGAAGLNVAGFMNRAGFKVLLIEQNESRIGGDCLNTGCIPSKALIHAANTVRTAHDARSFGIQTTGTTDMQAVHEHIVKAQDTIRAHENADYLRSLGMTVVLGTARFSGKTQVTVNDTEYQARHIVLACGGRPRTLSIPGSERVPIYTNETIFELEQLPARLLVIGGGAIACELGQAYRYLGSEVTLVSQSEQLLPQEDVDVAQQLANQFQEDGIMLYCNAEVSQFTDGNTAHITTRAGVHTVTFDAVLLAIGRDTTVPDELDVAAANIATTDGSLVVDQYLRTSNKRVLACGDVVGQHQFTHAAELHAGLILRNFFAPWRKKLSTDALAWVTFTNPEVATFGLSEITLQEQSLPYSIVHYDVPKDDRAIVDDVQRGLIKLFISPSKKILGGTILAPHAGEIVQELILAQQEGISVGTLFSKTYPYPTASRITKQALSNYLSRKLTRRNKKLLRLLYH